MSTKNIQTINEYGPPGPVRVTYDSAQEWVTKARRLASLTLDLAGKAADPAEVEPLVVENSEEWAYGNFMLAWLDARHEVRHVCHLPDASFFLRLLGRAYAPVFNRRPDLAELLLDHSRPEVSLTNDVLQIQLRSRTEGYSMVRNHALMLFMATLWLEEPRRSQWLDLYDEILTYLDRRPGGRPDLSELAAAEAEAFADFVALAPLTVAPESANELLDDESRLRRILDYQLYAGAAIGLLWRIYRAVPEVDRQSWQRTQLSELYGRLDYLTKEWSGHEL